jgi:hypothetical protein
MELLKFQKEFVKNKSRLKIIYGDRASGKTVTIFDDLLNRECNSIAVFFCFGQLTIFAETMLRDVFTKRIGWGYNKKERFFYNENSKRIIYLTEFRQLEKFNGVKYHHIAFINIPLYDIIMLNRIERHGRKIDVTIDFFGLTETYIYRAKVDDNKYLSEHFRDQVHKYNTKLQKDYGN